MPRAADSPTGDRPAAPAVEHLASALVAIGVPTMPARVWAALLSHPVGRLTASDLGGVLRVSPASISGAVRYLGRVGLIRREREPGGRRDVYVLMPGAWHALLAQADQKYVPVIRALDEGVDTAHDPRSRARLAEFREYLRFVGAELGNMAERWEVHRRAHTRDGAPGGALNEGGATGG